MKKIMLLFLVFFALGSLSQRSFALDEQNVPENLMKKFPVPKYSSFFYQDTKKSYYRFPTMVPFFDPLDLSYFPHETWNQSDWSLLGRWEDTWTYHQQILLKQPLENWTFHGTSIGKDFGFFDDFYLYATLFVTDNYPENTGSCYVYYSDSLLKGFGTNNGVLIDPQTGVYSSENHYESSYNLTNKNHELNIMSVIHPDDFTVSEDDIAGSSVGAADFIYEVMDEHFAADWKAVKKELHLPGSAVKVYRIELIREGGHLRVYLNGKLAAELDDNVTKTDAGGNVIPEKVSWSYGPLLYEGGQTVTCAIGDLYIRGKE